MTTIKMYFIEILAQFHSINKQTTLNEGIKERKWNIIKLFPTAKLPNTINGLQLVHLYRTLYRPRRPGCSRTHRNNEAGPWGP
jgi:hypothetical protein